MGKIRNPIRFSEHYGLDSKELEDRGILDPTLNANTKLFIGGITHGPNPKCRVFDTPQSRRDNFKPAETI